MHRLFLGRTCIISFANLLITRDRAVGVLLTHMTSSAACERFGDFHVGDWRLHTKVELDKERTVFFLREVIL